mmetsp:Transcript_106453/g.206116  ORF Transcript_106453/g.206116 Transcript_106453/m.206116 type:complete len:147 (+) Transcript_106453:95-535(+)
MPVLSKFFRPSSDEDLARASQGICVSATSFKPLDSRLFWSTNAQVNFDVHSADSSEAKEEWNKDESNSAVNSDAPSLREQLSGRLPEVDLQAFPPRHCTARKLKVHAMENLTQKPTDLLDLLEAAEKSLCERELRVSQLMLARANS